MPDPSSAPHGLALCRTLWLVVAWPLAGLAWQVLVARPRIARSRDANAVLRRLAEARVAGIGCVGLAAVAVAGHVLLVRRVPGGHGTLIEPFVRAVPLGPFDPGAGLLFDTRAMMACGLACIVALSGAVVLAQRSPPDRGWRPWAWLHLALAGALLSFLADGFVTAACGWSLVIGAASWLAGWNEARAGVAVATRGAVALLALVLGGALLFSGLSASPAGPTLSFHAVADDLALLDGAGAPAVRRALEDQVAPGGVALMAAVLLALLGAAGSLGAASPALGSPRTLSAVAAGATTSAVGPFLLVRLAPLLPSVQHAGLMVASVGAAIVLGAVWNALGSTGMRRWLTFAAGAPSGLTFVALGSGGVVPAMGVLVASGGVTAFVLLVATRAGVDGDAEGAGEPPQEDEGLLVRLPARLGAMFVSMERWVVGAATAAVGGAVRVVAWTAATVDREAIAVPGNVAATGLSRASGMLVPLFGVSRASLAWSLLAVAALAAFLHALWAGG
ncbi:MAG TPA: hypothetical protein VIF09_14485 [Polyangiaceae bacterium]|jgi:hypothetical protein